MSDNKHKNYEVLNLIGYGLAKFNTSFISAFGENPSRNFMIFLCHMALLTQGAL